MQRKVLMDLVEIKSAIASVLPFLVGILYSIYAGLTINWLSVVMFFIAAVSFHLATNIWDNFQDFRNAKHETFKQGVNDVIGREGVSGKQVLTVLITLFGLATILGFVTWARVGGWIWPLLSLISYAVAFLYSSGPKPISRTPFGEIASGLTMGYIIVLLVVLLNNPNVNGQLFGDVFLVSGLGVFAIANIMLANNTGDYVEDVKEERMTLAVILGQTKALILYAILYVLGYASLIAAVIMHLLPWTTLITLIAIPVLVKHFKFFWKDRTKRGSFLLTIKNTVILMALFIIGMIIGIFIV